MERVGLILGASSSLWNLIQEHSLLVKSCVADCQAVGQVLAAMEDGFRWPLSPGSYCHPSPRKEQPAPWGTPGWHTYPFSRLAGVGPAGQLLDGSYLSTSDLLQTWPEDSGSVPGGDVNVERARAQERSVGESIWGCEVPKELASVRLGHQGGSSEVGAGLRWLVKEKGPSS